MSNGNTTTTNTLSGFEVVKIAREMGLRQISHSQTTPVWEIAGYTITGDNVTGDYTIAIDGHELHAGNGNIVDALRDFITAGN